ALLGSSNERPALRIDPNFAAATILVPWASGFRPTHGGPWEFPPRELQVDPVFERPGARLSAHVGSRHKPFLEIPRDREIPARNEPVAPNEVVKNWGERRVEGQGTIDPLRSFGPIAGESVHEPDTEHGLRSPVLG